MNDIALMFSGGVDSTLCLKKLVDQKIIPVLFHFKTKKLNTVHEKKIKKIAKLLSPNSPYYVFYSWTKDYKAYLDFTFPFYGVRWKHHGPKKWFEPLTYVNKVVLGYTRWLYWTHEDQRPHQGNQRIFIDFCKMREAPFTFPLGNMKRPEIDVEFKQLPEKIRKLTVSSTRNYAYSGGCYID